jgi:hypothetical protein
VHGTLRVGEVECKFSGGLLADRTCKRCGHHECAPSCKAPEPPAASRWEPAPVGARVQVGSRVRMLFKPTFDLPAGAEFTVSAVEPGFTSTFLRLEGLSGVWNCTAFQLLQPVAPKPTEEAFRLLTKEEVDRAISRMNAALLRPLRYHLEAASVPCVDQQQTVEAGAKRGNPLDILRQRDYKRGMP